jgi:hypothetical protein
MFVAMNRFQLVPGKEADFEAIWAGRDSHLAGGPASSRSTCLEVRATIAQRFMQRTPCGNRARHSKTGPAPKRFAPPTPEQARRAIFTLDHRSSNCSMQCLA